jgi:gluconokinase
MMKVDWTVLVLMGVSGSGKTTIGQLLARELGLSFHEGDLLHPARNVAKMARGEPLDDQDRAEWLLFVRHLIDDALAKHERSLITCSALKEDYRRILDVDRPGVVLVYLKGDFDLIKRRMHERHGHFMKETMLASQFEALEEPRRALTVEIAGRPEDVTREILDGLARAARGHACEAISLSK